MATEFDYPIDLIDSIIPLFNHGIIKHINQAMAQVDPDWDKDLYFEEDEDGNPVNWGKWDAGQIESDEPIPKAPYLAYGRITPWREVDNSSNWQKGPNDWEREQGDEILSSTTTGAQSNGTLLKDGQINFYRQPIQHNSWISIYDESDNEIGHSFIDQVFTPHMIRLQDALIYYPNTPYSIYTTKMATNFAQMGDTDLAYAIHGVDSRQVEAMGAALRDYFIVDQGDRDLVQVQIKRKDEGKVPAKVKVHDLSDLINTDYVLTDNEKEKGVMRRRELRVTLRASESLHRQDVLAESENINITITK